jgi:hypothetical protein
MFVVNLDHPLTAFQLEVIAALTGQEVERVLAAPPGLA